MPALTKALWIASFSWAWRVCLPALLRQDNPWLPLASTNAPQGQLWGEQRFAPSLRPTATRTASLSMRSPHAVMGHAWSQSPLWDARDASSRALLYWSVWVVCKWSWLFTTDALSQVFCLVCIPTSGIWSPCLPVQVDRARSRPLSGKATPCGRSWVWRSSVAAAEAKKAEGASRATLLTPNPPSATGRLAWTQARSSISTFLIMDSDLLRMWSNSTRPVWSEQGEHLRVYNIFGALNEWVRMSRASCASNNRNLNEALARSAHLAARAASKASPLKSGAPRSSHRDGEKRRKPAKIGGIWSFSVPIISHLPMLRTRPSSAALSLSIMKSSTRMVASPPTVTSSRYPNLNSPWRDCKTGCNIIIIIIIIIIMLDLLASFRPRTINKLSEGDSDARGEWVDEQNGSHKLINAKNSLFDFLFLFDKLGLYLFRKSEISEFNSRKIPEKLWLYPFLFSINSRLQKCNLFACSPRMNNSHVFLD